MRWWPFKFDGKVYDLSHLAPKIVKYLQPASGTNPPRGYTVEVTYSMHCFTRGFKEGECPDPALLYKDSREVRVFEFTRYALSHRLPEVVEDLMTAKCFHTDRGNFFTVRLVDHEGKALDYEIYFTASKSSKPGTINLYVQSAYVRDTAHRGNRPQRKPIRFPIILLNVLNKTAIRRPQ